MENSGAARTKRLQKIMQPSPMIDYEFNYGESNKGQNCIWRTVWCKNRGIKKL